MSSEIFWALFVVVLIFVIGFVAYMRRLMRESREAEKKIDKAKLRRVQDEQ